ncbi:multidrug effflux MFS transporter [Natronosporangium hydrolyticum]|uniref:Multidrug effflux MFS transporter n=1 Tax=Natronosporangium hydrolyticum TaxID=2811111 RepID=A0A895YCY3_9ACTN|nr:multidrug effflux MFS transporter [Natronosporangium hydrolyticum]QSB15381.1 multidrug effflux MFS transporter [Natronosporangium hydrolyticum]
MPQPQAPTTAAPSRGGRGAVPSLAALVVVMGIGPFATDTYIAALPQLQQSLSTTATVAQLTLSAFIVGLAAGQLLLGPVSDARGRRGILIAAAATFVVTSVCCALAPNGVVLVLLRLVQGFAAGGGVAMGRAVVTDSYRGAEAAAKFGTIASFTFLGPVVAPVVGGLILIPGTWRTVFWAITALGVVMLLAVLTGIPETLPAQRREPGGLRPTWGRMADLLRDAPFRRHVAVLCLAVAGFFTYIGGSSFVLQTVFGMTPTGYAAMFATNAAALAAAALCFRSLVTRFGAGRLRAIGVAVSTLAAVGLCGTALVGSYLPVPLAVVWVLLSVAVAGMGFTLPATTALAQEAGRRAAGTASALQGGLSFLAGALVTPVTGLLGYHSLVPMAALMAFFHLAALVVLVATRRHGRLASR